MYIYDDNNSNNLTGIQQHANHAKPDAYAILTGTQYTPYVHGKVEFFEYGEELLIRLKLYEFSKYENHYNMRNKDIVLTPVINNSGWYKGERQQIIQISEHKSTHYLLPSFIIEPQDDTVDLDLIVTGIPVEAIRGMTFTLNKDDYVGSSNLVHQATRVASGLIV